MVFRKKTDKAPELELPELPKELPELEGPEETNETIEELQKRIQLMEQEKAERSKTKGKGKYVIKEIATQLDNVIIDPITGKPINILEAIRDLLNLKVELEKDLK